jgi:hypothetical protein
MWVLLLWVGVAGLLMLSGCLDALSFPADPTRGEPAPAAETADVPRPALPAADEVVLKWNGTLVVAEDGPPATEALKAEIREAKARKPETRETLPPEPRPLDTSK